MKLSEFDIDFIKFKNEKDSFSYKLDNTFFELKENSLYHRCSIDVQIECQKKDSTLNLDYTLYGVVYGECERCLKSIETRIDSTRNEVLKLTLNDDLLKEENYLNANHQVYNVYDSLYEEICLSMPSRKICENSIAQTTCEIDHPETDTNEQVDERWSELKKLIDK